MALIKCKECKKEISKKAKKCPNCGTPLSGGKFLGCGPFVWLLAGVVVILGVIGGSSDNKEEKTFYKKPSSTEITLTEAMKTDAAAAIREAGFNCPKVKIAYAKGEDAYGTATKVFCGPADSEGVYEKAVFRLTFMANDMIKVEPWK